MVNGIAPDFRAIQLAVIPCGTGNDLARALGFTPDRIQQAYRAAVDPRVEAIDVVRITEDDVGYFINVANGGFGGRIASDVSTLDKQRWGPFAYWMTSMTRLMDLQIYDTELTIDGKRIATTTYGVAIANGRYVGGGFPIAPRALLNDGQIDVTTIPVLPTLELMAAGVNLTLGRDHHDDRLGEYRGQVVHLRSTPAMPFSVDGEPTRRFDAEFEVLGQVLRVALTPETAAIEVR